MLVHLYGVVRADTALPEVPGRQGAQLRLVERDGVAVVVSDADEQRRVGAADLLAHARVLEGLAEYATVVPMRFGIMLPDDTDVGREVLEKGRSRVVAGLEALDGLVQVSLRVFMEEEPALRRVMQRQPELVALRKQAFEPSPPVPTPQQVELGEHVVHGLRGLGGDYAEDLWKQVEPCSVRTYRVDPDSPFDVLNAALLVDREDRGGLDDIVGRLRREHAEDLVIRYVGPQPPYCFVEA